MSVNFTLERTEQFLQMIKITIEIKKKAVYEIEYAEGKEKPEVWEAFPEGTYWGKNDTWYWFRTSLIIPEEYAGETVKICLVTGREGAWNSLNPQLLVMVDGKICQALDTNHHEFTLTSEAKAGECFQVEFQAYAGREYDNISFFDIIKGNRSGGR